MNPTSLLHDNKSGIILLRGNADENTSAIETLLEQRLSSNEIRGFISLGDAPIANAEYLFAVVDNPLKAIKMAYALIQFISLLIIDWEKTSIISNEVEFCYILRELQKVAIKTKKTVVFFLQKPPYPNVNTTMLWATLTLCVRKNQITGSI